MKQYQQQAASQLQNQPNKISSQTNSGSHSKTSSTTAGTTSFVPQIPPTSISSNSSSTAAIQRGQAAGVGQIQTQQNQQLGPVSQPHRNVYLHEQPKPHPGIHVNSSSNESVFSGGAESSNYESSSTITVPGGGRGQADLMKDGFVLSGIGGGINRQVNHKRRGTTVGGQRMSVADQLRRSITLSQSQCSQTSNSDTNQNSQATLSGGGACGITKEITIGNESQSNQINTTFNSHQTDIEDFLVQYASVHPLSKEGLSNIQLLVKNEDFHLYSVTRSSTNEQLILKVICHPDLFYSELATMKRFESLKQTGQLGLRLLRWFQFRTPLSLNDDGDSNSYLSNDETFAELDHFYMLFEMCSSNLYQIILTRRQQALNRNGVGVGASTNQNQIGSTQGQFGGQNQIQTVLNSTSASSEIRKRVTRVSCSIPSVSSWRNIASFDTQALLPFSEQELRCLITRLVSLYARMQCANVAQRNIKPANLVFQVQKEEQAETTFSSQQAVSIDGITDSNQNLSFGNLIACNFEMSSCFAPQVPYELQKVTQEEKCSAIYASTLVQNKVHLLAEKADSEMIVEVAENQEESVCSDTQSSVKYDNESEKGGVQSQNPIDTNRLNWASQAFNPYVEDVFSLGLTILQTAYQCSGPELKQMRVDPESLILAVEQLSMYYSDEICCILMFMVQWETAKRPDFITLEHLVKNEFHLDLPPSQSPKSDSNFQQKSPRQMQVIFDRLCASMMSHEIAQQVKIMPKSVVANATKLTKQGGQEKETVIQNASGTRRIDEESKEANSNRNMPNLFTQIDKNLVVGVLYADEKEFLRQHAGQFGGKSENVAQSFQITTPNLKLRELEANELTNNNTSSKNNLRAGGQTSSHAKNVYSLSHTDEKLSHSLVDSHQQSAQNYSQEQLDRESQALLTTKLANAITLASNSIKRNQSRFKQQNHTMDPLAALEATLIQTVQEQIDRSRQEKASKSDESRLMMAKQFQENQQSELDRYQTLLGEVQRLEAEGKAEQIRHNLPLIEEVVIEANKLTQNADIYACLLDSRPNNGGINSKSKQKAIEELKQKMSALVSEFIQINDME